MSKSYKNIEILWASVREPYNYLQAKQLVSYHYCSTKIIEKIENLESHFLNFQLRRLKAFSR